MSGGEQQDLGTESFARFLNRAGSRIKGVYTAAMGTWTVIHGLPLVVGLVISRLIDDAGDHAVDGGVWGLLALAIGLMVLRAAVLMGGLRLTFTLIFQVSSWIKTNVLARVLRTSSARMAARGNGDVLNRLREDTEEIGGLLEWTTDLIYRSVLLVAAVAVLVSSDPVMTLPLVVLLGGLGASVYLKRRVAALQDDVRNQQGEIATTITDLLTGIRDIRLADAVGGRVRELDTRFAARRRTQVRHQIFSDLMADLFRNTVMIGTAAVLLIVSTRIVNGDFSIGKLVLFLTYIAWLGEQMFFFGYILARIQSGRVSYDRLAELVEDASPRPGRPVVAEPLTELEIAGLTCAAGPDAAAPQPVSVTVRPGQLVAVTGEVGSGKSTFVRSLMALQPEVRGSVLWNGTEIAGNEAWCSAPRIVHARQSPRFLRGTVRENLTLGSPDVTDEQLERALAAVRLAPGTAGLPDGLDTMLDSGEARQISGGQRQRLALARMLCRPAQVYVVDDCDSSVDAETARLIWETLPAEWPGAWIVVSHNPDLLARADTVIELRRAPGQSPPEERTEAVLAT
ncbi:ATP-binding cassette domain-containing protein [Streptomyces hokutonensis]|uniref:ATP-binding cassette domain-containing protein n=1 Tax=Streptomyces hokutonensis TaxID=1306990 RepID=UPI003808D297